MERPFSGVVTPILIRFFLFSQEMIALSNDLGEKTWKLLLRGQNDQKRPKNAQKTPFFKFSEFARSISCWGFSLMAYVWCLSFATWLERCSQVLRLHHYYHCGAQAPSKLPFFSKTESNSSKIGYLVRVFPTELDQNWLDFWNLQENSKGCFGFRFLIWRYLQGVNWAWKSTTIFLNKPTLFLPAECNL